MIVFKGDKIMISNLAGIVETITNFFTNLANNGYLTPAYIFYVGIGLELVMVIFFLIKSSFSYELRLDRTLDKLNRWLYYNQYIDEKNLIDFNRRIKKAPKLLKYHWQQFMLYREHEPSYYMSNYNCIDKPLHTSSFTSNIKNLMSICWALCILTFLFNLITYSSVTSTAVVLANSLLTPVAIIVLNTFFSMLLRSWQNSNLAGLYQNFHLFNRYVDKACSTLPDYIDFEILFTKDEIRRGIPVLNEFLEKRARQEQKELEDAKLNAVEHEEYDFDELGLDGSQILDRAMKETEIYLNQRQRVMAEIQQLESEIESLKRNFENNQKEYQRKMQASKENVDRLRKQQEESTNRIESNYIRKQQSDEIKKQEQLEKDYEGVSLRFNQESSSLTAEIETRKAELEESRLHVEDAMKAEYKTFSTKIFNAINDDLEEKSREEKQKITDEKNEYQMAVQTFQIELEQKQAEIDNLHKLLEEKNITDVQPNDFYDQNLRDAERDLKYGDVISDAIEQTEDVEPITEIAEDIQTQDEQSPAEVEDIQTEPEQVQLDEPVYDEYGGYYDEEGYYRYKNGTYYDPEGNYFDEFGGHFDKDGNYYPPETAEQSPAQTETEQVSDTQPEDDSAINLFDKFAEQDQNSQAQPENQPTEQIITENDEVQPEPVEEVQVVEQNTETEQPVQVELVEEVQPEPVEETQPAEQIQAEMVEAPANESEIEQKADDQSVAEESSPAQEKPKAKRGRPKKVVTTENAETKPKGKRGRPKKVATEEDVEQKPKAKRGRPKKVATEESTNTETKPKGKRGRPKKVADETSATESKPRAKRGRPAKKTTKKSATSSTKPAAKRGRPKKSTTTPAAKKSTGKRGRPKKEVVTKTELFDELEKLNQQIQEENEKLKTQQEELNQKIDETLSKIDEQESNNTDNNNNAG